MIVLKGDERHMDLFLVMDQDGDCVLEIDPAHEAGVQTSLYLSLSQQRQLLECLLNYGKLR